MKEVIIKNDDLEISIKKYKKELTWKEIMVYVIDNIKGHGYISKTLDDLQEEWYEI